MKRKFAMVGSVGAGKTTLFNAILGRNVEARKTQAVEYEGNIIDTPGEFFNHPRLYHALITTIVDVDTIIYVHPANDFEYRLPQGLLEVNEGKEVLGVITKIDCPDADIERVETLFKMNGFEGDLLLFSTKDPKTVEVIKERLALRIS